jgi:hypothetical protein
MSPVALCVLSLTSAILLQAAPVPVQISPDGSWQRGGKPYFIKGAGGGGSMEELVRRGGNSVRTWGHDELTGPGGTLARAEKLGLSVCAGIWLESECSWFSYKKPEHCAKQTKRVLEVIAQHKDHPALLCWGLGNEAESGGEEPAFWQQINALAKAVKAIDPHHPTFTAVAGFGPEKIKAATAHAPDLDFIGINTYAALRGLRESLRKSGWTRPWVVTEYGARGFWESPKTPWDSPLEQTSTEKADQLAELYPLAISPEGGCGGGYTFLWGWKQEATGTWFSLFSQDNEPTGSVDALQKLWTGQVPKSPVPRLTEVRALTADGKPVKFATLAPGEALKLKATVPDDSAAGLSFHWAVRPEAKNSNNQGRDPEPPPDLNALSGAAHGPEITLTAPQKPGPWRVFLKVRHAGGGIATGNVPFLVKGEQEK